MVYTAAHYLEENLALVTEGAMQQYGQTTYKLLETDLAILQWGREEKKVTIKTRRDSRRRRQGYQGKNLVRHELHCRIRVEEGGGGGGGRRGGGEEEEETRRRERRGKTVGGKLST